ncbi:uncharacterized protein LOC111392110 [Olea europaea var. sylvestris]|uniref:uncharacterized protein LOC111392110 n=1 Tax=Olea europaea var. sylvestris TaxID=158386 RepID=UPI000C1D4D61|nr:uncharacterized protein LOC111392110 [Olea europaea var. sylvestris]
MRLKERDCNAVSDFPTLSEKGKRYNLRRSLCTHKGKKRVVSEQAMVRTRDASSSRARTPAQGASVQDDSRDVVIDRLTELAVGERFRKLNPPIFEDALDPTAAKDWLRTLENMFRYTRVSEVEKVVCASFMLRGSAGHWWDTMSSIEDVNTMTRDRFKELFRNKYFTAPVRAMKMNEFIQLRQGGMTVGEYNRKFEQLSRFATHMINTDALKVERFLKGLRPELYRDVSMAGILDVSYSQIAEKALVAEQAEQRISRAQETRRQFRQGQQHWDQGKHPRIDQGKALIAQPSCPRCGGQHTGACPIEPRTCYVCGKVGHLARACPSNPNPIEQKKVPARVFTITRSDAEANPAVVTGKFSIFGIPALVLFDSGATNSFVSTEYVRRLGRTPDIHEVSYSVTIPSGDVQQTNLIVRACAILIEN